MLDVATSQVTVNGSAEDVRAFMAEPAIVAIAKKIETGEPVHGFPYAWFEFHGEWKTAFSTIQEASGKYPDVVAMVVACELTRLDAEGRVFRNGEQLGAYDMPDDDVLECCGEMLREEHVFDYLVDRTMTWEQDALGVLEQEVATPGMSP